MARAEGEEEEESSSCEAWRVMVRILVSYIKSEGKILKDFKWGSESIGLGFLKKR